MFLFFVQVENLTIVVSDFYVAGSATTASAIRWFILYMAIYPGIQTKLQQELDSVVPANRLAQLTNKYIILFRGSSLEKFGLVTYLSIEDILWI